MKTPIIPEGTVTFADYFKLNAEIEDILATFGYSYRMESSQLPRKGFDNGDLGDLKRRLERALPHVSLINEAARREFLIAPVLMEVIVHADAKINVEFSLDVDEKLKGTLDYLVRARHSILVVEAKHGDLKRGFTQLAVELVALDRWAEDSPESRLHGVVSMGNVWQFGILDRVNKRVTEDLNIYSVPKDLEDLAQILVAILTEE